LFSASDARACVSAGLSGAGLTAGQHAQALLALNPRRGFAAIAAPEWMEMPAVLLALLAALWAAAAGAVVQRRWSAGGGCYP
jgi:hypothetical protein